MTDDLDEVVSRDPMRTAPRIAAFAGEERSQYFLIIEREVLCELTTFSQAIMVWFVSHYVFNLEYCPKTKEVALFFQ